MAIWWTWRDSRAQFVSDYLQNLPGRRPSDVRTRATRNLPMETYEDYFIRGYVTENAARNWGLQGGRQEAAINLQVAQDYEHAINLFLADTAAATPTFFQRIGINVGFALHHIGNGAAIAKNVAERKASAIASTTTKLAATNHFIAEASQVANDRQNVHDSNITGHVRTSRDNLARDAANLIKADGFETIRAQCIAAGVQDFDAITDTPAVREMLELVWNRAYLPPSGTNPAEYAAAVRDAVISRLRDCRENGHIVCTTGRITQILDALTLLDPDACGGHGMKTNDMYRAEIFNRVKQLIDATILANLNDPRYGAVAASYSNPGQDYDDVDEAAFKAMLGREISAMIDRDYSHVAGIDRIKNESLQAI
jgi:hypothetical protein